MGNALREDSRLDEAMQCYKQAIKLKPDHPHGWNNYANALKDAGETSSSSTTTTTITHTSLCTSSSSSQSSIHNSPSLLAILEYHKTEHKRMLIDFMRSEVILRICLCINVTGEVEEAVQGYLTAIELMPRFPAAHSNLGNLSSTALYCPVVL